MRVNTKTLLTIASVSLLFVACGWAPNKKEQNLAEILTTRLDSLTKVIESEQKDNVSEELILMQKVLEWRLDSIERVQRVYDSLDAENKKNEIIIRDSIRILNSERDSIQAYIDSINGFVVVSDSYLNKSADNDSIIELLSKENEAKNEMIRLQNEKIVQGNLLVDSLKRSHLEDVNKNNPLQREMEEKKEIAIAHMNYCILASYGIRHSPSLEYFENKKREMNSMLTMEPIKGIPEIHSYRQEIRETLDGLILNEYEKEIYYDILEIEKKNRKLVAVRNALQVPQFSVNVVSSVSNALLTAARAGIDLAVSKNEAEVQNIRSMWDFRKEELYWTNDLVKNGFNYIQALYDKYDLKEYDRLTDIHIEKYFNALAEDNPNTRMRRLEDDSVVFRNMYDYYYNLGMTYIEVDSVKGYKRAEPCFDEYLRLYGRNPLFQKDDKTGIIALTRLLYGKILDKEYQMKLVEIVKTNLPENEIGYCVGARIYYDLEEKEKAFNLLREGIDRVEHDEALIEMALHYMKEIEMYDNIYERVCGAILDSKSLTFSQYAACVIGQGGNSRDLSLKELLVPKNNEKFSFYINKGENSFVEAKNKKFIENDISLYHEIVLNGEMEIYECNVRPYTVSEDELLNRMDLLKKNDRVIPFFFERIKGDEPVPMYAVRLPFEKLSFNRGGEIYKLVYKQLNTVDYSYTQNDSLWNVLVQYCDVLSEYRQNLLFENRLKVKKDSMSSDIVKMEETIRILSDSTKNIQEKSQAFKVRVDSLRILVEKYKSEVMNVEDRVENLKRENAELEPNVKIPNMKEANWAQKKLMQWGWYEESQAYEVNKKELTEQEEILLAANRRYSKVNKEYLTNDSIYKSLIVQNDQVDIVKYENQKNVLAEQLAYLGMCKDGVSIYGKRPAYKISLKDREDGEYLKIVLGDKRDVANDSNNDKKNVPLFKRVVLTYRKSENDWVLYSSEMIDGTKYKLVTK